MFQRGEGAGIYYVGPLSNCSITNIGLNKLIIQKNNIDDNQVSYKI